MVKEVDFLTVFDEELQKCSLGVFNAPSIFDESKNRGAPIKIDREQLWGEFAAHLLTLSEPPSEGEAVKYLQNLCTAELNCHEPSRSSLQRVLKPFFVALERRKQRVPKNRK